MEAPEKTFIDKLIAGLKNAASELEELQVQVALGKSEAKDLFEELKKNFENRLQHLKSGYLETEGDKTTSPVLRAFEQLRVQLGLGIAETKEVVEEQIHKIRNELTNLEFALKEKDLVQNYAGEIQLEFEKFKAKLELIALGFQLKKLKTEFNIEQKKIEFHLHLDKLRAKILLKQAEAKHKWDFFKKEIDEAYHHLKIAFVQH
ncbi:hypothetical protein CNR22_18585 [Sphingobacteriaceae bacterium]|nr:hypothetical protein CNR22_18585 [Sphingobacteriaceae bacterium]